MFTVPADVAAVVIQDLESGVAYNVDVVGRVDINERVLPDVATGLIGDLYIEVIGSGNIRGTNRNIGVAANAVPVRDSQTRRLSRRIIRVIARDVECEIDSAGDAGARQNDGV